MSNEEIQAVMNSTFAGLTFFCRDANLDKSLISKYQTHQILLERGFTDVSYKIGGIGTNCRFLIASSKGKDLSVLSPNPEFGHIMIQSGAYFKVLDIRKSNHKTQILLLNIPQEGVEIFGNSKINLEEKVIEKGAELFKQCIETQPLEELQANDWLQRTSFPIGMNQEGIFFLEKSKKLILKSKDEDKVNEEHAAISTTKPSDIKGTITNPPKQEDKKKGFWNNLFGK